MSFAAVLKRREAQVEAVGGVEGPLEPLQWISLATAISRHRRAAAAKGAATM